MVHLGYRVDNERRKNHCAFCNQSFKTMQALQQHLKDSPLHHICGECLFDGQDHEDLLEHYRQTKHRIVCGGCYDGVDIWIPGSQAYLDHLEIEHVCLTCHRHHQNGNNLDQVCPAPTPFRIELLTRKALDHAQSKLN